MQLGYDGAYRMRSLAFALHATSEIDGWMDQETDFKSSRRTN